MQATVEKLATAKSPEAMGAILAQSAGKLHCEPHALGYEVRDLRPLVVRLENPVKGRGVLRWFGDTHFVISAAYAVKLGLVKSV